MDVSIAVNSVVVCSGLLVVGMGAFAVAFPMRIRSFVSTRRWRDDPETAEQYQQLFSYALGATLAALGLVVVGIGSTNG